MTRHVQRTVTTLAGILVSLVLTLIGSAILYWGIALPIDKEYEFARELIKSFGSVVLSIGMLSFMWELFTKRTFLAETLALANMTVELKDAGIERVTMQFMNEVQWGEMLRTSHTLDFFFSYARTWCNVNSVSLAEVLRMKLRVMRVLLPDPNNAEVVAVLAHRFNSKPQDVIDAIKETTTFFERLGNRAAEGSTVQIRYAAAPPLVSMYLLGERAVFTLHSHQNRKGQVPTYVVKRPGLLYQYLDEEFTYLWDNSRVVYPKPT